MKQRTALGRARGLGPAHEGSLHWWRQRVTALALVPLAVWFILSLAQLPDIDLPGLRRWFAEPLHNGLSWLLLIASFYHAALGLRVILEDYVAVHELRWSLALLAYAALWVVGLAAGLALIRLLISV